MTAGATQPIIATNGLPKVMGDPTFVELTNGQRTRVVSLNNAATTPPLEATFEATRRFLETYGALHRGAGPRARMTCEAVEAAIATIRQFLGCSDAHALVFTGNTSAAVNFLARTLRLTAEDVVVTSDIEHTSNHLPWLFNTPAKVEVFATDTTGAPDYVDLERTVAVHGSAVRLVVVTGASNQTGYVPDLPRIARIAHDSGALLFVDAAQLAPHRPLEAADWGVDALALSGHKVYAPFGVGVLMLPVDLLGVVPVDPGGGSIDMISDSGVVWAPALERHQTGTWNVTGIVALATSCEVLQSTGWEAIRRHERDLIEHTVRQLATVPGLTLHVPGERYLLDDRIGTFPFSLDGVHYAQLAAVLEHEHGIEVRAGTICNHRLVRRWFDVTDAAQTQIESQIQAGDRLSSYGIVRASLGLQNTFDDIDRLVQALGEVSSSGFRLRYRPNNHQATYEPVTD